MTVSCFIEYKINPFKREAFNQYAKNWANIIPRCGGELVGYFLPHEGTNYQAFGIISFDSLRSYETYRERLKQDSEAKQNFQFAQDEQFILEETRRFLTPAESTYWVEAQNLDDQGKFV